MFDELRSVRFADVFNESIFTIGGKTIFLHFPRSENKISKELKRCQRDAALKIFDAEFIALIDFVFVVKKRKEKT